MDKKIFNISSIIIDMEFSNWLIEEMNKKEWSQSDLARHSGLTRAAISNYISGSKPNSTAINKLAKAFKISPSKLFEIVTSKSTSSDPWADQMAHKLNMLDDLRKGIAQNLLDSLIDQQEKEQAAKPQPQRAKP